VVKRCMQVAYLLCLGLCLVLASSTRAQEDADPARAETLIRDAIKARGGEAFLKVRTLTSRGFYTAFEKGLSGLPREFVDYIAYPDSERTEFGKGDHKLVQSNASNAAWIYDAEQKMIRDQTEEQVKNFKQGLRYDLDNLLRRGWQEPGVKLVYIGRREIWRNTFSEAVRIDYADGFSVTLHLDPRAKLPLMVEYKADYKNQDDEVKTGNNQIRYFRWIDYGGIQFPTVQDSFRDGVQLMRVNYDTVTFNGNVPEKLFIKPTTIKEVK
jgi:hypothetical protein